jgi:hypothetical protein
MRDRCHAKQAAATSAMEFFVGTGMLVRHALVGMPMRRAIGMNMRLLDRLIVMNMRGDVIFEAMRRIVRQRDGGMRRENAEPIEQRERQRRLYPKSFGET